MNNINQATPGLIVLVVGHKKEPPFIADINKRVKGSRTLVEVAEIGRLPVPNEHEPEVTSRACSDTYGDYLKTNPIYDVHIKLMNRYEGEIITR